MYGNIWWCSFCGNRSQKDAFWDYQLSVNTSNPDLTRCFQTTVLTWVPCGLLWIWSPFHIRYLSRRATIHNKWTDKSLLNAIKLILGAMLCITLLLQLIWLFRQESLHRDPPPSEFIAACLLLSSLVLATVFVHYEFKKGDVSSGILFVFWAHLTLCNIIILRSYILDSEKKDKIEDMYVFVTFCVYFGLLACQFLLSFKADCRALRNRLRTDEEMLLIGFPAEQDEWIPTPQAKASFFSSITYFWITGLLIKGYKKVLGFSDLHDLMYYDKSNNLVPKFEKAIGAGCNCESSNSSSRTGTPRTGRYVESDTDKHQDVGPKSRPKVSLLKAIVLTSGPQMLGAVCCRLAATAFIFTNPQLLRLLIAFIERNDPFVWKGYLIAVLLLAANLLISIFLNGFLFLATNAGMRLRTMLTCAIYRKSLRLSSEARRKTTVGQIVNLMSIDAVRIQEASAFGNLIWDIPLAILLSLYFLWDTVGPSSLAGFAVWALIIPTNAVYMADKIKSLQTDQMTAKDDRIKILNEVLSGIKVLKLYAWETSFQERILSIREKELTAIKRIANINALGAVSWFLSPYLVSLAIFTAYVLSSPSNILDAGKAFVSLSIINVLNFPLSLLPLAIAYAGQSTVSVKRLNTFLRQEELEDDAVQCTYTGHAVSIANGTFSWSNDDRCVLSNVEMDISIGSLIAVVGQVGSGKSSLIASMLGEMRVVSGHVSVHGSVAYVPQQAWIQNATVKDNILFGKQLEPRYYQEIIKANALELDLQILPWGDLTEIGEKGINMSGGQKQRVSLARAVYQDCDVYLLDDPLSAVDAHVGKHIFEQVIGPNGILKDKTRILVTHDVTYLPQVDRIVLIKDGVILEEGAYEELLSHDGAFVEFVGTYLKEKNLTACDAEEYEDREVLQHLWSCLSGRRRIEGSAPENPTFKTLSKDSSANKKSRTHRKLPQKENSFTEIIKQQPSDRLIQEERAESGAIKRSVLMMYIRVGGVGLCMVAIFSHLLFTAAQVGTNIWLSDWSTDVPINGSWPRNRTHIRLGIYGALGVAQGAFALANALAVAAGSVMASRVLHAVILDRVLRAPMSYFDTTPLGRIVNRLSRDMDVIDFNMPLFIRAWLFDVAPVLSTLIVISYATPNFLIIVLLLGTVYYLLQKLYISGARQFKRIDSIRRSPLYVHFDESAVGATSIRAYRQEKRFIGRADKLIDDSARAWFHVIVGWRWLGVTLESLGALVVFFAALLAVIQRGSINSALAGLSVSYAIQVTERMNTLVRSATELETYIVSVERIKEYCEVNIEADWVVEAKRPPAGWPDRGLVEFVNYSTKYRPGLDLVLTDITFRVEPGQKVGIVGRTGSGKSSLTMSLFPIIESAGGQILIDGTDISKVGLHDLRSRLTIIPQDPVVFSGSLRMNLDPLEIYQDDAIWRALEHAHLKAFISGLKEGLNYECGDGGETLSVGQRQLVCLARALLRNTKILILDEATAAVDMETDDLIQRTICTEFSHCTVLTIAHRLNTIMDYDKVLVLDKGITREFDAPSDLLKDKKGVFHGMAKDAGII